MKTKIFIVILSLAMLPIVSSCKTDSKKSVVEKAKTEKEEIIPEP